MTSPARALLFGAPAIAAVAILAYGFPYRDHPSDAPVPGEVVATVLGLLAALGPACATVLLSGRRRVLRATIAAMLGVAVYVAALLAFDAMIGWF